MNNPDSGMDLFEFAELAAQQAVPAEIPVEKSPAAPAKSQLSRAALEQLTLAFMVSLQPDAGLC